MKKIYIRDLACYRRLSEEERKGARVSGDTCLEIPSAVSENMQDLLCRYITWRGEKLSLDSMRAETWQFRTLSRFLAERHADLEQLYDLSPEDLTRSLKVWMVKNGYALTGIHSRKNADTAEVRNSPLLLYLKSLCRFAENEKEKPEMEKDIWTISKLGFEVRDNPVKPARTLNFEPIRQRQILEETKLAFSTTIRYLSVNTLNQQLGAMKRFSLFLDRKHPDVRSAKDLSRDILEDYLIYLNTQVTGKKSFRSELTGLKSLIDTIALCEDDVTLHELFLPGDATDRGRIKGYRAYSDAEVKMWNEAIRSLPPQIARVLVIHQLLGNRIGETLTLTQDCICKRGGHVKVRVFQIKKQNTVYKPAGEKVRALIEKACSVTNERYGKRRYIFVSDKDPDRPMTYGTIKYHLMKLVREMDLRNENGELYGVGTHAFRHTLGKRLTQMHYDDKTIAQLLGHSGLESINRYRTFGSTVLAKETRTLREWKGGLIEDIAKEW